MLSVTALSATPPTGLVETTLATGIDSPTAMAIAPDGRIFVCSQTGALRVIKNGVLLPAPFVTLPVDSAGERGLLGIAFDPDFATNQFVYLYRTIAGISPHNRVSRFTANGDVVAAGSEKVILDLDPLSSATNHNGGALHFGPDRKLYIAVGDNANGSNSQTLNNLLGKILRLNPDGTIPSDNPFSQQVGGRHEIWAMGLRNPFTFAFNPTTGLMYINDVGLNTFEEIDLGQAGANYGWPSTEGPTSNASFKSPIYYYAHSDGCAITGGAFYTPTTPQFPSSYEGKYFFADYCSGFIRTLDPSTKAVSGFATGASSPVDIQVGADGSLYYLARGTGSVMQISSSENLAPAITTQPASKTVSVGSPATFSVAASGPAPLSYQWLRNGANISGATLASYTFPNTALSDNGAQFQVRVTNSHGSKLSATAVLTVTANRPPSAQILTPAAGTTYFGGMVINYSGSAVDPEDGTLPPSAFTWQIDFHHDTHLHPFLPATTGSKTGTVTIPDRGETSANVFYRLILTTKDSGGLVTTIFRDIIPQTSQMTFATDPAGLQISLDGAPSVAPQTVTGVAGIKRTIAAPSPQIKDGFTYTFKSWSDGQSASHEISTPIANTTYTATFKRSRKSPGRP
jgi:glucose/arabinose dehydrogenase